MSALARTIIMNITRIEAKSNEMHEHTIYWKNQREIQRKEEEKKLAFQERREKEVKNFKDMFRDASRWQQTNNLRNCIDAMEANAKEKGGITEEILSWLAWARNKADWYDPFIGINDELLNDVNPNQIR